MAEHAHPALAAILERADALSAIVAQFREFAGAMTRDPRPETSRLILERLDRAAESLDVAAGLASLALLRSRFPDPSTPLGGLIHGPET